MSEPRKAAQAIDALRRGWPVRVGTLVLLAVETADDARLAAFDPDATANILLAGGRAATLKITNQRAAGDPAAPVLIERARWLGLPEIHALADPALDLRYPFKGPFRALDFVAVDDAGAALELARLAGILPAFFVGGEVATEVSVEREDVVAFQSPDRLAIVARVALPVAAADSAQIVAFRSPESIAEHVALVIGEPAKGVGITPPLVRLHSECLTGDVFGSLKCDCGPQLDAAIAAIAAAGHGILLYLRQEGRGIGLINKLRAYQLQDQGFDTVDANVRLGFAVDARDFGVAARMLDLLGVRRVRLLTNNPAKVAELESAGIEVVERVPHALAANAHNARYLATKRDRTGHAL